MGTLISLIEKKMSWQKLCNFLTCCMKPEANEDACDTTATNTIIRVTPPIPPIQVTTMPHNLYDNSIAQAALQAEKASLSLCMFTPGPGY